MTKIATSLIACLALAAALPAAAGAPDTPGARGAMVNDGKTYWQDKTGEKNAWGKTVSGVAKGENPKEDRKLGVYLGDMIGGPNPLSDNGRGNN